SAVESILDRYRDLLPAAPGDNNTYSFGSIGKHNVVVASLGTGDYGTVSASGVPNHMRRPFQNIRFGLMVEIAGGISRPKEKDGDVRLGDILVGCANGVPSVINYRLGKSDLDGIRYQDRNLQNHPRQFKKAVSALKTQHEREGPTYLENLDSMFHKNPRLDRPQIFVDYYNYPKALDYLFKTDFVY
ncbi:hypothetical protein K432DRAFT_309474, partial [Lepidopterella palustris CBS 459.81]